jgi:biopolymer transport protein ExbB
VKRAGVLLVCSACSFHRGDALERADAPPDMRVYMDAPPSTAVEVLLTLHNNTRNETLTDFPVLVALDPTRIDYSVCAPGGGDLRFFAADNATPLQYEIESWQPGATSAVWVRVPSIPALIDANIWMHYGDPAATTTANPPAVWSSEHVVVWHLGDDPASGAADAVKDSTSHAHHGTSTAQLDSSRVIPGVIGNALEFQAVAPAYECVLAGASSDFTLPVYTWSGWFYGMSAPSMGTGGYNKEPLSNGDVGFNFAWDHNLATYVAAAAQRDATAWAAQTVGPANIAAATWYHVAATYDGSQLCSYLDGAAKGCVTVGTPLPPNGSLSIGGPNTATGCAAGSFLGRIDEVRVANVARSQLRLQAEYLTEADLPASPFVTFGTPQKP